MQYHAAVPRSESFMGVLERLRTQAMCCKGTECACCLILKNARPSAEARAGCKLGDGPVRDFIRTRATLQDEPPIGVRLQAERLVIGTSKATEQRAGRQHAIVLGAMPAEYNF